MRVIGDEPQQFHFRLGNESSIEWIAVVMRRRCHLLGGARVNRQVLESVLLHLFDQIIGICFQFAQTNFDCDFQIVAEETNIFSACVISVLACLALFGFRNKL